MNAKDGIRDIRTIINSPLNVNGNESSQIEAIKKILEFVKE